MLANGTTRSSQLSDEIVMFLSTQRRSDVSDKQRGLFKIVLPLTIDREGLFEALPVLGTLMEQVLE